MTVKVLQIVFFSIAFLESQNSSWLASWISRQSVVVYVCE